MLLVLPQHLKSSNFDFTLYILNHIIFIPLFSGKFLAAKNLMLESVFVFVVIIWALISFGQNFSSCIPDTMHFKLVFKEYMPDNIINVIQITKQEIIQEFNLGVGSHVSITLWCELCSCGVWEEVGTLSPHSKIPSLFCYISLLGRLIWNTFFDDNWF